MARNKYGIAQLQVQAPVAGDRAFATWLKGKSSRYLMVTAQATYNCTVAVTGILGLGSVWQLFDWIGIDEGGKDFQADPRFFVALTETLTHSPRTKTRVTSLGTGTVTLREQIMIPFELLGGGKPGETRFRELLTSGVDTRFFYQLNGVNNGIAKLVTGGTATITGVTVQVEQYYDNDLLSNPPLFKPWWAQKRVAVPAANSQLALDVDIRDLIRGITILQNTSGKGMVTDIINKFAIQGANLDMIGRGQPVNWDEFARSKEMEYGGDVYAGPLGGIVHHNFQQSGRLSNVLNPGQDTLIQLIFDCQPSAVAGAVSSEIVVLYHTLTRNPVRRTTDGVYVTNPVIPPALVAA